ncbi:Acg family FMN-binding oxidoreductase [Nocardia sp. alder85J]|uniref:Acg family FMN-binding oxidoreductase n=1 Tax=Nocardia sp. alder85J TaxID=2862949 RepID=UPI001CD54947|nr:nitroreductase family protein [Nocardia sp. alder85J]MCX4092490.1 nitroreductase family protein [Nocardia sp. alder85J]
MNSIPSHTVIEKAVLLAGRAPSLHNSQPWQWIFDGVTLQLFVARERSLPNTDSTGRQSILGCGIALGHLRAALVAAGWRTGVSWLPDPNHRDHLATVRFAPALIVTEAERDRADAILRRRTDRLPFDPPANWDRAETVLRSIIDPSDAVFEVLPEHSRRELAPAARLTADLRRHDSGYQAELQWWTGHVTGATGIPASALTSAQEQERVPVGRSLPVTSGTPRRPDREIDRSVLVALSTDTDRTDDVLRCGEALSTLLLECTAAGYATCPLTHLIEFPRSRSVVRDLLGGDWQPQVLVRIGSVPENREEPEPTPRLPLSAILRTVAPQV